MAITYFQTSTVSDLTGAITPHLTSRTASSVDGGSDTAINTGNLNSGVTTNVYFFTETGEPGTRGTSTGSFTVVVRITTGNTNLTVRAFLARNNPGTDIAPAEAEQTCSAGTKTFTWTNPGMGTWVAGDRFRVRLLFTNTSGSMNQSCQFSIDSVNDTIATPFTTPALSISPGVITASATINAPQVVASASTTPDVINAAPTVNAIDVSQITLGGAIEIGAIEWLPTFDPSAAPLFVIVGVINAPATLAQPDISQSGGVITLTPGVITATTTMQSPTVTRGAVTTTPGVITATATLQTPTVTRGAVTTTPGVINATAALQAPTVVPGAVTLTPAAITATATLQAPTVTRGAVTTTPGAISATATLNAPTVLITLTTTPGVISAASTVHAAEVIQTGIRIVATNTLIESAVNTSHVISLPAPAGGILANDILLICAGMRNNPTYTWDTNWTEIVDLHSDGAEAKGGVAWFRAAGGETGTTTFTTSLSTGGAARIFCIRGAHTTSTPESGGHLTGNSTAPNSGALDPSGWASESSLWFAIAWHIGTDSITAGPASYSDFVDLRWNSASGGGIATSSRVANTASEDPGAFTLSPSSPWGAMTLGVRPAFEGLSINPGVISASPTMQAPTLVPGQVSITPGSINAAATVNAIVVAPGAVTLTPASINAAATVQSLTAIAFITPGVITATASPRAITVAATYSITPASINAAATLQAVVIQAGVSNIAPGVINATASARTPTLTVGAVSVIPAVINAAPTVHSLSVNQFISPAAINAAATPRAITITVGAATVAPNVINAAATVQQPIVNLGAGLQSISPARISAAATINAPTLEYRIAIGVISAPTTLHSLTAVQNITPNAIAPATTFHQPTLARGAVSIVVGVINAAVTMQSLTAGEAGAQQIAPSTISAGASPRNPTILPGPVTITAGVIAAAAVLQTPGIAKHIDVSTINAAVTVRPITISIGTVTVTIPALNAFATIFAAVVVNFGTDPHPVSVGHTEGDYSLDHTTPSYSGSSIETSGSMSHTDPSGAVEFVADYTVSGGSSSNSIEFTEG